MCLLRAVGALSRLMKVWGLSAGAPAPGDHPEPLCRVQQRRGRPAGPPGLSRDGFPGQPGRWSRAEAVCGEHPGRGGAQAEGERRGEPEGGVQQHGEHPSGGEDICQPRSSSAQRSSTGQRSRRCLEACMLLTGLLRRSHILFVSDSPLKGGSSCRCA